MAARAPMATAHNPNIVHCNNARTTIPFAKPRTRLHYGVTRIIAIMPLSS
jgi:hypothetical protein